MFDLTSGSSGSLSPDTDVETLRTKLKEVHFLNYLKLRKGFSFVYDVNRKKYVNAIFILVPFFCITV